MAGPITLTWLPLTNQGYMVGDYISTSISSDGKAHSVFAIATAPVGGVFDEAMYAPVAGMPLGMGKPLPATTGAEHSTPNLFSGQTIWPKYPTAR